MYSSFQTFAVFWMSFAVLWVIPRCLNFICRRFGTLCLFHLHRQVGMKNTYLPLKMEQTECSEMLAYKIQMLRNYPQESKQHLSNVSLWTTFKAYLALHTDGIFIIRLSTAELTALLVTVLQRCSLLYNEQSNDKICALYYSWKCLMVALHNHNLWPLRLVRALSALRTERRVLICCMIDAIEIKWQCKNQQPQNERTSISQTTMWMSYKQQLMPDIIMPLETTTSVPSHGCVWKYPRLHIFISYKLYK